MQFRYQESSFFDSVNEDGNGEYVGQELIVFQGLSLPDHGCWIDGRLVR